MKSPCLLPPCLLSLCALLALTPLAVASTTPSHAQSTVPVLMLSDIHLDPFHDPAKFSRLNSTPASGWAAILYAPASPTQAADFAHLQSTCNAKGVDTPPTLLASSLHAEQRAQSNPLFVTVSGDLMAHQFDCRFHTLDPTATPADYSAFAAKTIAFIALQLRHTFPHAPIYFALGNNDSGCHDYREDPDSSFLHADAASFAADAISPANRSAILKEFPSLGDDNILLPAPIHNTRLIILQDLFESKKYAACNGAKDNDTSTDDPATQQIAWLRAQLTAARAAHQHVWIMAHIPPGIDAYSTFTKHRNVCAGKDPEMFLATSALAQTLADFPDTIRLALFGHTHMDEFRLFRSPDGQPIPGKLVPSITPVNGNNPAFTVAQVEPTTATLKDYTVYAANNKTGIDTQWTKEYTYSTTYHEPDLSGTSLAHLTSAFVADHSGTAETSKSYQQYFYAGESDATKGVSASLKAAAMQIVWPTYACAITNADTDAFRTCACPTQ